MTIIFSTFLLFLLMFVCSGIGMFALSCMVASIIYQKSWLLIVKETIEYFIQ